jgi:gas vesicle protein
MNDHANQERDYRLLAGLVMGSVVGAGLAMWMAPRARAEIRARAAASAKQVGDAVAERYEGARLRVAGAVEGLTRKGQQVRDDVCDTVVRGAKTVERGAREVQRSAAAAKTDTVV